MKKIQTQKMKILIPLDYMMKMMKMLKKKIFKRKKYQETNSKMKNLNKS
jgi:hypothetical protein